MAPSKVIEETFTISSSFNVVDVADDALASCHIQTPFKSEKRRIPAVLDKMDQISRNEIDFTYKPFLTFQQVSRCGSVWASFALTHDCVLPIQPHSRGSCPSNVEMKFLRPGMRPPSFRPGIGSFRSLASRYAQGRFRPAFR